MLLHPQLTDCRRIFLRNREMSVSIGVYDREKKEPQRLVVNVDVFVPLTASSPKNDDLSEVPDYEFIMECLDGVAARGHINLQETFCDQVAGLLLAHPDVRAVRVSSEKPDAYDSAQSIGVEVFRIKSPEKES